MEYTNTPDENNTITLNNCVNMTYDKIFKAVCILGLQDYYEKQDVIDDERDVLLLLSDKDAYFLRLLEERAYKKCLEQIKSNVAYKMDTEPDFLIREVNLSNNDSSNIITPQEIYFQISFFIKLELEIRNYYNNGEIEFEGEYVNGEKNGKGKDFNYNGKIRFEGHKQNGKRNGIGKEFYTNGEVDYEGEYVDGEKSGKGKEYFFNYQTLKFEGVYSKGKRNGFGKEYNYMGNLVYEGNYINGEKVN